MSPSKKPSRGKKGGTPQGGAARRKFPYTPAERLRVVKLHLEEGLPRSLIVEETGIAADTLGPGDPRAMGRSGKRHLRS